MREFRFWGLIAAGGDANAQGATGHVDDVRDCGERPRVETEAQAVQVGRQRSEIAVKHGDNPHIRHLGRDIGVRRRFQASESEAH